MRNWTLCCAPTYRDFGVARDARQPHTALLCGQGPSPGGSEHERNVQSSSTMSANVLTPFIILQAALCTRTWLILRCERVGTAPASHDCRAGTRG